MKFKSNVEIQAGLTVDSGDNSTITIKSNDGGRSRIQLYGDSQGSGQVYVGQSASYGGGIEYNGDNSPGFSGAGSDFITLYRTSSGTTSWTARNHVNSNDWAFRGNISASNFSGTSSGTNTGDQDLSGFATLAGNNTFTGINNFNTNTNANPLEISRNGSGSSQVLKIGLTDTVAAFRYIEDTNSEGNGNFGTYQFNLEGNDGEAAVNGLTITKTGISAPNFSGSSSGTNTGDQDLSGYYQQGQGLVAVTTTDGIIASVIPPGGTDVAYGLDFNYLATQFAYLDGNGDIDVNAIPATITPTNIFSSVINNSNTITSTNVNVTNLNVTSVDSIKSFTLSTYFVVNPFGGTVNWYSFGSLGNRSGILSVSASSSASLYNFATTSSGSLSLGDQVGDFGNLAMSLQVVNGNQLQIRNDFFAQYAGTFTLKILYLD